jgi:hypothetical protein
VGNLAPEASFRDPECRSSFVKTSHLSCGLLACQGLLIHARGKEINSLFIQAEEFSLTSDLWNCGSDP